MSNTPISIPKRATLNKLAPNEPIFDDSADVPAEATGSPASTPERVIGRSTPAPVAPRDATEAEQRFWARYGPDLGVSTKRPTTVEEWTAVATQVRALLNAERKAQNDADPVLRSTLERSAFEAPADPLTAIVVRLETAVAQLERSQQAAPVARNGGSMPKSKPHYNGDGVACCPYHTDRALVESQYGGVYCKAKGGPQVNDKGYCSYSWKE